MAAPFKYTVSELKELFAKYKEYRSKQYDIRYDSIKSGERAGEQIEIKIPKVYTIASFCHYIGITEKSFYNWINEVSDNIDPDLLQFVTCVREEIKDCQLSGATNGVYNATIVSRINGLSDTVNVQSNVTLNSLPLHINNNIIDLTESDYTILNETVNKAKLEISE